jgi:hypothetical protein
VALLGICGQPVVQAVTTGTNERNSDANVMIRTAAVAAAAQNSSTYFKIT